MIRRRHFLMLRTMNLGLLMAIIFSMVQGAFVYAGTEQGDSGWFETTKEVPADWANKRVYLKLAGVQCDAVVWVNNQKMGEVIGPDAQVDITSAVVPGQNASIRLWVTNWWENTSNTRANDPFRNFTIKSRAQGSYNNDESALMKKIAAGITDAISLQTVPFNAEIDNVLVEPSFRQKALNLNLDYFPHLPIPGAKFSIAVTEMNGSSDGLPSAEIPIENQGPTNSVVSQNVSIPWAQPHLWDVGAPYLYQVLVKIVDANDNVIDSYDPIRFGFREIWTEGKDLILNGHPLKLRMAPFVFGVPQMIFYEGMGFNAMEIQPNGDAWFAESGLFPTNVMQAGSKDILNAADERGWVVLMPTPSINNIIDNVSSDDPVAQQKFIQYFKMWMRQIDRQNHASVLMWSPSMNKGGPYLGKPEDLGENPVKYHPSPWFAKIEELIKSVDPTRLVYNHDGGQTGDMGATNLYLNFAPLQEREDYLSNWSQNGQMPWGAIEFGTPFSANFFKPANVPLYTEYTAMYLGDEAYADEKNQYINESLETTQQPITSAFTGSDYFAQKGYSATVGDFTGYKKFMDLFIRNTNKSWRTWGVNGGLFPWIFDVGFGIPPGHQNGGIIPFNYSELTVPDESLKQRPSWANNIYDDYQATMQPLLVSIGGPAANFTTKDHNFIAGENVEKSIDVVWDGAGTKNLIVNWKVMMGGQSFQSGQESFSMNPGTVEKRPIHLTVPNVNEKTPAEVQISVYDSDLKQVTSSDSFGLTFFPVAAPVQNLQSRWGIYDPKGITTSELAKIGYSTQPVNLGDDLSNIDVLIIGYQALSGNSKLPFTAQDIANGKRVLFFEQDLKSLENLGFRAQDVVPRYTFPRVKDSPILNGIGPDDLINWRGAGELLPTTDAGMRVWPWPHATHWGNNGSVASVVIETPQKGAFTPIIESEFDLAYSPLLEWKDNIGKVLYSQLDLTGRIGVEPAATVLASNMIHYLDTPNPVAQNKQIAYLGNNADDLDMLQKSGFRYKSITTDQIQNLTIQDVLVVGTNSLSALKDQISSIQQYVQAGGTVLVLPQTQSQFTDANLPWNITIKQAQMARINPADIENTPILRGIGPQLVHWRTFLNLNLIDQVNGTDQAKSLMDGLLDQVTVGNGSWIFDQFDWRGLNDGSANLKRTRWNAQKFYSLLMTNLGVQSESDLPQQMFVGPAAQMAPMANISSWQVATKIDNISTATQVIPGSNYIALTGLGNQLEAENWLQDPSQPLPDGLGWNQQTMNANGYLDFTNLAAPKAGEAAVATTYIYNSKQRDATFSLSSDWWFVLKVNGQTYVDQSVNGRSPNAPRPGEVNVKIPLQQGWNKVEMKVGSGSGGFGFWCTVTDPGDLRVSPSLTIPQTIPVDIPPAADLLPEPISSSLLFTEPLQKGDDPYGFTAW